MLTGGFDVLGLFACANPEQWKSVQARLRQVQFSFRLIWTEFADDFKQ